METNNDITGRKRAEEALRRLNRELRAISNCNQTLLRATDEQTLLDEICRIVCQEAGYRVAWVGYVEHDEAKTVRPVAWTGTEAGYLANLGITWADTERGGGPTGTAIRSGKTCCIQDFATDPGLVPWRESAWQHDFRSGLALPLKDEQAKTFGSLTIYSAQPRAFTSEEIRLLEELAADLAFGIVTLRSRAARQQAEQEVTLLSFALDRIREAAFLVDDRGRCQYVNEEACRVLGYPRSELLGMSVADIDPEFPAERWTDHWQELKEQRSLSFESRHRTREGRVFPVEVSANYFEFGSRPYNLALVRDITERKRAEEALRESERKYHELVEHANSIILHWQHDGRIIFLNEFGQHFFGYTESEIRGRHVIGTIVPETDSSGRDLNRLIDEIRANPSVFEQNVNENMRRNGERVWIAWTNKVLLDSKGEVTGILSVGVDVTARKRMEEELRLMHFSLEHASDAIYWMDPQGHIVFVNEAACHSLSRSQAELLSLSVADIDPVFSAELWRSTWDKLKAQGSVTLESCHRTKEGRVFPVEVTSNYLDFGGKEYAFTFARDITGRKRAEEALRRSEAYLAEAQRLAHTGSWAWNPATRQALYFSEEMFRIFGLNPQQGVPNTEAFWQRIHPEDFDRTYELLIRASLGSMEYEHDHRIVLPDGTVKHIHAIGHPVLGENGQVTEYVGTAMDVTEQKRAEKALRRTGAYLADAQRLTHTGAWALDFAAEPLYWSEEVFRIWEFDPQQGLPTRAQVLQRIHPEDLDKYRQFGQRVSQEKVDSDVEVRAVMPDGTVKYVNILGHPLLNAQGELVEVVGTTIDITDRKRAEEERERLRQLEADLRHLNRVSMLGELAASVVHEVNQPISGVVSNAGACLRWLAREVPDLEEARQAVHRIVRDGKRAGEVIARIRALAKRAETPKEKLDLNETIREVLALAGDEAKRKSVIIRTQFADDLLPVSGDRVQLQQVTLNLVMNAIEAMSSVGDRAQELRVTTCNLDADQVVVTVEDSGIGIDPETLDKIFDSFYTTKPGGMGMGLSISRSILQVHGGRLWATAKDGPGTIFHFTLPKCGNEGSDAGV